MSNLIYLENHFHIKLVSLPWVGFDNSLHFDVGRERGI